MIFDQLIHREGKRGTQIPAAWRMHCDAHLLPAVVNERKKQPPEKNGDLRKEKGITIPSHFKSTLTTARRAVLRKKSREKKGKSRDRQKLKKEAGKARTHTSSPPYFFPEKRAEEKKKKPSV